jgi:peptidyl-prolyl cis-trans isomerase C
MTTRLPLALFLLLLFPVAISAGSESDSVVAKVNSESISADELRSRLHEYQVNLKGAPSPEGQTFRERVLNELIEEKVMLAEAKSRSLDVSPEELDRALKDVEKDYSKESFDKQLSDKKISYSRWRSRMRLKLLLDKVIAAVTKEVPPPTEGAVAAYYRDHEPEFRRPEQVHLQQIVVKTAEDAKRIADELKKGKPFEQLARMHSFTPEASQGGDLGLVEKGVMPPAVEEAYLKLPVGKISSVIQTEYGFHVVRVLDRHPDHLEPLTEAKPQIVRTLTQQDREQKFSAWRRDVLSRAKIERNHALLEKID